MITQKRREAFLYLSLAIIGMMLLGVGLPNLRFQAGFPIPEADPASFNAPENDLAYPETVPQSLLPYWLAFGIIFLFFALMTALLKKVNIKRLSALAAVLGLLVLAFSMLPNLAPIQTSSISDNIGVTPQQPFDFIFAPIGEPPASLLSWIIVGLLLASVVLISLLVTNAFHRVKEEDKLATEAEAAIQAIAGGQNLREVIIHYYLEMENVVAQGQGIERGLSVTPREFEVYLVEKGIPRSPVLKLTFLFEKARYGNQNLNEQDEQDAVNSFLAIQIACQSNQRGKQ